MGFLSRVFEAQRQNQGGSGMGSATARPVAPRPTLIQGGPAFFTPEGYVPPVQPEQAFMPTDVMRDPIRDMFAAQPQPIRIPGPPKMPPPDVPPMPPIMCFVAGTKIDMADGTKKVIENIMVGDEVMALNNTTDKVSYVHDIPEDNRQLWTINNRITATDAHAFLTEDGWKSNNPDSSNLVYGDYNIKVTKLSKGDKLITNEGVEEVTDLKNEEAFTKVYNFSTDATHTYMVDGVVSHNKMPPMPPIIEDEQPPVVVDEPPVIVEEPPIMGEPPIVDEPIITMDDINRIRRERGGPRRGDMMPPILDRKMIDYGYGPGIMPPTPDIFLDDMETRPIPFKDNPFKDRVSDMVPLPDMVPVRKPFVQELRPPMRDQMSIDKLPALPRPDMMPIRLPEPMPMLPEPMPMRPRMPMPGPIATPMPMAPINLPKIELPKIERNEPMMPRRGGIESLYSPRMMAEGGEVVDTQEEIGLFDDTPLANYILSLQSPERSEIINNLIGVSGIAVGSAESIPMFIKRLIQTGSLTKPEVEEVIQESLEKNTSQ